LLLNRFRASLHPCRPPEFSGDRMPQPVLLATSGAARVICQHVAQQGECAMQTFDFFPFYRSTVAFDRLFSRLADLVGQEAKSYRPYNIERTGEAAYRISVAVAGFAADDIAIESKENNLLIRGGKVQDGEQSQREFLHRGIAERAFELRF